jgi:hypothetical protein
MAASCYNIQAAAYNYMAVPCPTVLGFPTPEIHQLTYYQHPLQDNFSIC